MLPEFDPVTLMGVLEFDGLISVESGVAHTTPRFRSSLDAARKTKRGLHADLRAAIAEAMHTMYGRYLSESEMQSLVDAMLPIAASERRDKARRA